MPPSCYTSSCLYNNLPLTSHIISLKPTFLSLQKSFSTSLNMLSIQNTFPSTFRTLFIVYHISLSLSYSLFFFKSLYSLHIKYITNPSQLQHKLTSLLMSHRFPFLPLQSTIPKSLCYISITFATLSRPPHPHTPTQKDNQQSLSPMSLLI